jgi:hypothetical protein
LSTTPTQPTYNVPPTKSRLFGSLSDSTDTGDERNSEFEHTRRTALDHPYSSLAYNLCGAFRRYNGVKRKNGRSRSPPPKKSTELVGGGKNAFLFLLASATSQHGNAPGPCTQIGCRIVDSTPETRPSKGIYPRIPIRDGSKQHFSGLRQSQANRQQIFRKPQHRTDDDATPQTRSPLHLQLVP